jgi:hypothetical protein
MAIEHEYFGILDDDASGGLYWEDTVELADQAVDVELFANDQTAVTEPALDQAATVIRSLEGLDARARDALIAQLSERESVTTQYIDHNVDELGESLLDLLVHNSGDIAMDVLRSLQLVHVVLYPERDGDDEAFATFDYSIDPDETDAVLTVSFDDRGDVVAVDAGE